MRWARVFTILASITIISATTWSGCSTLCERVYKKNLECLNAQGSPASVLAKARAMKQQTITRCEEKTSRYLCHVGGCGEGGQAQIRCRIR